MGNQDFPQHHLSRNFKEVSPGRPCYEIIIIMIYRAVDKTERIVGVQKLSPDISFLILLTFETKYSRVD